MTFWLRRTLRMKALPSSRSRVGDMTLDAESPRSGRVVSSDSDEDGVPISNSRAKAALVDSGRLLRKVLATA